MESIASYLEPAPYASTTAPMSVAPMSMAPMSMAPTAYSPRYAVVYYPYKNSGWLAALIIVLTILLVWWVMRPSLAKRLARKGWVLYTRDGCSYCDKQLLALRSFDYPLRVHCGRDKKLKLAKGTAPPLSCASVKLFPFWYNLKTGASRAGTQSRAELKNMA